MLVAMLFGIALVAMTVVAVMLWGAFKALVQLDRVLWRMLLA